MSEPRPRLTATAVSYQRGTDRAPRIVAAGRDEAARRIIAMAQAHGIPVREDDNLAALLDALDVDMDIPPELYRAVAEVLVFVYRMNGMMEPTAPEGTDGAGI